MIHSGKLLTFFSPILILLDYLVELIKSIWSSFLKAGMTLGISISPTCLQCSFAMENICKMALQISALLMLQQF